MPEQPIIVSVVMPLYNEEKYIGACIESLLKQSYDPSRMEILLVDGDSKDRTCEIIESYVKRHPHIRLLHNPSKTVPYAMNIGIRAALGEFVVRLDAHSEYADDYVQACVDALEQTGADNVGGPMVAVGRSRLQRVVAASYESPFALGGGRFHDPNHQGDVDTVYLGAFRKEIFDKVGMFDERFTRNQDDELNLRIANAGGKIYLTPKIRSLYYSRASLKAMCSQYFQYGEWKVAVIRKHKKPARLTHLVPAAFVLFNAVGLATLCLRPARVIYLSVMAVYALLNLFFSFSCKKLSSVFDKLLLVWVHVLLHVSYGAGFLKGIATKRGY